jgi:GT2 family glycosyltransferase
MDLSIVIVSYNSVHLLGRCLSSIRAQTVGLSYEIIVVDNRSSDGTLTMLRTEWPAVRLIACEVNHGFAAGNNIGIHEAKGEMILLLNPDTEILNGAIQQAVLFMAGRPAAGIIGCMLRLPDGSVQQSVRSFPSVLNLFSEASFLYLAFPRSRIFGRYYMTFFDYTSGGEVDWVSGAFFLIRRTVLETVGLLDERFFMYSEEMDLCYRAKQAGFKVYYTPSAAVAHFWGGINAVNQRVILWTNASQVAYITKHHDGLERAAMLAFKFLGLAVRIPVYLMAGLLRFNAQLLAKAWYLVVALVRIPGGLPEFRPRPAGEESGRGVLAARTTTELR